MVSQLLMYAGNRRLGLLTAAVTAFLAIGQPAQAGEAVSPTFATAELVKAELAEASKGKLLIVSASDVPKAFQEKFLSRMQGYGITKVEFMADAQLASKNTQVYVNGSLLKIGIVGEQPATTFSFPRLNTVIPYIVDYVKQKEPSLFASPVSP